MSFSAFWAFLFSRSKKVLKETKAAKEICRFTDGHGDAANTMMKVPVLSMSQKLCNGKGVDDDISSDLVSNNIHQVPPGCVRKKNESVYHGINNCQR